jgi:hypothetical protein
MWKRSESNDGYTTGVFQIRAFKYSIAVQSLEMLISDTVTVFLNIKLNFGP